MRSVTALLCALAVLSAGGAGGVAERAGAERGPTLGIEPIRGAVVGHRGEIDVTYSLPAGERGVRVRAAAYSGAIASCSHALRIPAWHPWPARIDAVYHGQGSAPLAGGSSGSVALEPSHGGRVGFWETGTARWTACAGLFDHHGKLIAAATRAFTIGYDPRAELQARAARDGHGGLTISAHGRTDIASLVGYIVGGCNSSGPSGIMAYHVKPGAFSAHAADVQGVSAGARICVFLTDEINVPIVVPVTLKAP